MNASKLLLFSFATVFVGPVACVAIAGVGDYGVDPCFDGCADSPILPDGAPLPDGSAPPVEGGGDDAGSDANTDVDAAPPPSPGLSELVLSGTGVAVGKTIVATLTARNETGDAVPRVGSTVTFAFSGGTSVLTAATATDLGNGTYRALLTGVTEGTKVSVVASLDGAPLKTPPPEVRVANPVTTGLTFMLDAANADNMGNAGAKNCPASGPTTWTDLGASHFPGTLSDFATTCGATSGWAGTGTPEDPFRLAFDGTNDSVDFGAVNSIVTPIATNTRQTILAWVRKTGAGTPGSSGVGNPAGLTSTFPIVTKGTADGDVTDDTDVNYFLSITDTNVIGIDYEVTGTHANVPLVGTTALADDAWYFIGYTLDIPATSRVIYLNAKSEATSAPTGGPSAGALARLVIGGATRINGVATGRFKGDVAVVMTYNRALTVAEIEKNCHAFSSRFGMKACPN
ncbi:MAG: hypothetical protein KF819_16130 [Labilithrix sp.]|nr:hypothetical protein [Labilithrix sp.]